MDSPPFTRNAPAYSRRTQSLAAFPTRRQSSIAAIVLRKKGEVDIVLDGPAGYIHSYSTNDEIKGHVEIRFERDTPVYGMSIMFQGQTSTYVENMATTSPAVGRTLGRHIFLRMQQPIDDDMLPEGGIALAGQTYTVPFQFVVPDRLLVHICSHKVDSDVVRKEHLSLPPSMGDTTVAGDGYVLMDDLAPDMAKIVYGIHATVMQQNAQGRILELAQKVEKIRIVPGKENEPPMNLADSTADYNLRMEKSVKRGMFKTGKIGRLVAETSQPTSLRLPHPSKRTSEPVTTMTTISLRFDPATPDAQPPELGSLQSKLKVQTFFGASSFHYLPEYRKHDSWSSLHGIYSESIPLSSRNLSTVNWVRHEAISRSNSQVSSEASRRPSVASAMSVVPEPSTAYVDGSPYYTANVVVPISLPTTQSGNRPKMFLPTFHSCIAARVYSLDLQLSYHTPGTKITTPSISLKSPIQISSEAGELRASHQDEDAIAAEIEHQFGLYESRQITWADGYNSPGYDETPSYEASTGIDTQRHVSISVPATSSSPPDYFAGTHHRHDSGGPNETQREFYSRVLPGIHGGGRANIGLASMVAMR